MKLYNLAVISLQKLTVALLLLIATSNTAVAADRPNILVIWGDDIGIGNISAYNRGIMGYSTPNIDRLAREGMLFTDYYGEQSCTAGRSAFITGQHPLRTGLTKVGFPGATIGIQPGDPTLPELLRPLGYTSGQFGKNHLGDRDEYLPTNHGFDEFKGNLYHLNSEEEPEHEDYPTEQWVRDMFSPRGVIHSFADGRIQDTGALTRKRMETVDEEFLSAAKKFIDKAHSQEKPFFVWFASSRMHHKTHVKKETLGRSGQGFYNDAMLEHDDHVGALLDQLDELGIADNTIVFYSTDNGPHFNFWPDGAITPYRSEKNTTWEGGFRVPALVRWPGKIAVNSTSNEIMSHLDWVPTLMAAVGQNDIKGKLLSGHQVAGKTFTTHLDGYNFLPYLTGEEPSGPRENFFYFTDGGELSAVRMGDWKVMFSEQRHRRYDLWREQFDVLRQPKLFNLRRDPFERADTDSNAYNEWVMERVPIFYKSAVVVGKFMKTFEEYPPSQKPQSSDPEKFRD